MRVKSELSCKVGGAIFVLMLICPGKSFAEGLKPLEYHIVEGTFLRLSGHINMGLLIFDDGLNVYSNFVDNENSSSRARVQFFSTQGEWKFETNFEVEYQPLASNEVSQLNDTPNWDFSARNIRKAEFAVAHARFGKLWLGQGSMASDGSAEVDKSGTSMIAYSNIPDTAGGYFFRFNNGLLSDIQIGDAFTNLDGLGRKFRVRYDSPTYKGFGLRTSYGGDWLAPDDGMYDVAGVYTGDFETFALDGAMSWSRNEASDTEVLVGSVSGLHKPTGISLTFAAGQEDTDTLSGYYGYGKLGYEHDFFDVGSTAFSIDYYRGKDFAARDSEGQSVGLAVVQNIDQANLSLWFLWRNHSYQDDNGKYRDGQAFFAGGLFRF